MQEDEQQLRERIDFGFASAKLRPTEIPRRVGGVAVVCCGADERDQLFALRVTKPQCRPELLEADLKGFEKASEWACDFDGIVQVNQAWSVRRDEQTTNFVKMEWCEQSLYEVLKNAGPEKEAKLFHFLANVATIVDSISARGYAHCDLKESNLLIQSGQVKLADFGSLSLTNTRKPSDGQLVRTPEYAPPELLQGHVHPTADIYGLAVIYAVQRSGLKADIVRSILDRNEPIPQFSAEELRLIRQATDRNPQERPAYARQWFAQLQDARQKPSARVPRHYLSVQQKKPHIRIGILGVSNAGKTTYLAVLGHPAHSLAKDIWIEFHDSKSHEHVMREFNQLLKVGNMASTARTAAQTLAFTLNSQTRSWLVETIDYAGETVLLLQKSAPTQSSRDAMMQKLSQLDALIFVIDSTDERLETLSTWNAIVPIIKEHIASGRSPREPAIAYLFSKVDQTADSDAAGLTAATQRILAVPLFATLLSHKDLFKRAEVFFTTAMGHIDKKPPLDPGDLSPANVLTPWIWCCERACEEFQETMNDAARDIRNRIGLLQGLSTFEKSWQLLSIERRIRGFEREFGPRNLVHDDSTAKSYAEEYKAFRVAIRLQFIDSGIRLLPPAVTQLGKASDFVFYVAERIPRWRDYLVREMYFPAIEILSSKFKKSPEKRPAE